MENSLRLLSEPNDPPSQSDPLVGPSLHSQALSSSSWKPSLIQLPPLLHLRAEGMGSAWQESGDSTGTTPCLRQAGWFRIVKGGVCGIWKPADMASFLQCLGQMSSPL